MRSSMVELFSEKLAINSEAFASELIADHEEVLPPY